jgi:hypothetical protein
MTQEQEVIRWLKEGWTITPAEALKNKIKAVEELIYPLQKNLVELEDQLKDAQSIEWIEENEVTADQVQLSWGDDFWFVAYDTFGRWLRETACTKPWVEWNGRIHRSEEIKDGYLRADAPGLAKHVKGLLYK